MLIARRTTEARTTRTSISLPSEKVNSATHAGTTFIQIAVGQHGSKYYWIIPLVTPIRLKQRFQLVPTSLPSSTFKPHATIRYLRLPVMTDQVPDLPSSRSSRRISKQEAPKSEEVAIQDLPFPQYSLLRDGKEGAFLSQMTGQEAANKVYKGW
jgi:hypothetical protein